MMWTSVLQPFTSQLDALLVSNMFKESLVSIDSTCHSGDTVSLLLSHRSISPNAVYPPGSGTTALHLAASIGRSDVVSLLLEQEGIDDTLRDSHGRTCKDVARGKDVLKVIKG